MTQLSGFTRRQALGCLAGLTLSLALPGCDGLGLSSLSGDDAETDDLPPLPPDSITIGLVPWIGYAPFYVAQGRDFFAQRQIVVQSKEFWVGADALASFAAGNLTAQAVTNPEAVAQAARGVDLRVVMVADASAGGDGILARDDVRNLADLQGRQVAVDQGGTSYYFLLQALKQKAGLTVKDIELVNMPADAAAMAYEDGTVDVAVTYEPFLSQSDQAQPGGRILLDTSELPTAILDLYLFQPKFVEDYPEKVQGFVDALLEAQAFIEAEPEESHRLIAANLGSTPDEVAQQMMDVELTSLAINQATMANQTGERSLLQNMIMLSEFLVEQGSITAPLNEAQVKTLIAPQFVQAATEPAVSEGEARE